MSDKPEPMSEERLAEILRGHEVGDYSSDCVPAKGFTIDDYLSDILLGQVSELLREVRRLRAELQAKPPPPEVLTAELEALPSITPALLCDLAFHVAGVIRSAAFTVTDGDEDRDRFQWTDWDENRIRDEHLGEDES